MPIPANKEQVIKRQLPFNYDRIANKGSSKLLGMPTKPLQHSTTLPGRCFATCMPPGIRWQYPGRGDQLARICRVAPNTARNWLYDVEPMPAQRAVMLADWLEARSVDAANAARELRAYAAERDRTIDTSTRFGGSGRLPARLRSSVSKAD